MQLTTGLEDLMIILNNATNPSDINPASGIIINTNNIAVISKDNNGVKINSKTSGILLRIAFSILANIYTPIITPIIPPLPVVKIEFRGTASSYSPNVWEIATIFDPIEIAPIIPPKASVAPNCFAELIPV